MDERQRKLLDMLKWFHEFCETNALTYYAVGGTTLGAIRHNGFIPWDDDIDVGMPREDYDKFYRLTRNLDGRYVVEFPCEDKNYVALYAKVFDTQTTLIEKAKKPIVRGIYIDVFPLDGVGNDEKQKQAHFNKVRKAINLYYTRIYTISKRRSFKNNFAIFLMKLVPPLILSKRYLIKKIDKLCRKYKFSESEYVASLVGAWGKREIMKREWFDGGKKVKFEDGEIYVPQDAHEYLTKLYGEYNELPPLEKRVAHHGIIYEDLSAPYKSYQEKK